MLKKKNVYCTKQWNFIEKPPRTGNCPISSIVFERYLIVVVQAVKPIKARGSQFCASGAVLISIKKTSGLHSRLEKYNLSNEKTKYYKFMLLL